MIIYKIKEGESIFDVAAKFNTGVKRIAADNDLLPSIPLTEGQDLIITSPSSTYTVSSGDTIEKILSNFSLDREKFFQSNPDLLSNIGLYTGRELVIDGESPKFGNIKVMSSLKPSVDKKTALRIMPYLTSVSLRSCALRADGSLFMLNDGEMRSLAREHRVVPIMEIQPTVMFDKNWWDMFSRLDMISRVAKNIKQAALSNGYRGINLNFGEIPEEMFDNCVELISTVKSLVDSWEIEVIVTVPEETVISEDMELLCDAADTVALFPKNIHDDLMDVLEIEDLTRLVAEVADSKKISLCVPMSGIDESSVGKSGFDRKAKLSTAQAIRLAQERQAPIIYDESRCLAEYDYFDMEMGALVRHRVTFECLESMYEILCMGNELGVGSINVFNADKYYAPFWRLLSALYNIDKKN